MCAADDDRLDLPLTDSGRQGEGEYDCVGVIGMSSDSRDDEEPDRSRGGAT